MPIHIRLLTSRLFWEILVLLILGIVVATQAHRLDHWRGLVREADVQQQVHALNEESQARQRTIDDLKKQVGERAQAVTQADQARVRIARQRPSRQAVRQKTEQETLTDEGLLADTHRLLPGVAVRLARRCE